jgi:16S rRNA (uracil1498-N3)-methyltransferase
VIAARSQRTPGIPQAEKRLAHWRQVAIAACEQCGRNRVPVIDAAVTLAQWLSAFVANPSPAVLLAPAASRSLAASVATHPPRYVLVGPEGGWTTDEINQAGACGIDAVHMGPRVLRTETAVIAALATLNAIAGDAR